MTADTIRTKFANTMQYDVQFERELTRVITEAILQASLTTDTKCLALRTSETIAALTFVLSMQLALVPGLHQSKPLRDAVEKIAKRLRAQSLVMARDPETERIKATSLHWGEGEVEGKAQ